MRSGVGLCVLGLLCLHSCVSGQDAAEVQPEVPVFCDDPFVEKAVSSALHSFNERLSGGHMLALFQIVSAMKSDNGSGSVYSLQFTSRRSDCPVMSNKPWTDCDYLPYGHKRPISCNATVYMTEREAEVTEVDCLHDGYIVPGKAPCLGCPEEIDENSEDLKVPLSVSISKYNTMSNSTHLFNLHTVGHATRQVVAGFRFKVRFDMKKTTCAKAEHKDLNELCVPDDQDEEFMNCNSTVDVAPWRHVAPETQIECESGPLPSTFVVRRRPPGWSPLRHFLFSVNKAPAPSTTPPSPSPSQAAAKEESSEEDALGTKPTASPANDDPFHCPTKPWKPFHPADPAPTEAATEAGFSDLDLVG